MVWTKKNFCRNNINNYTFSSGDEFIKCNFSQSTPNTVIMSGLTGLNFIKCNLINCVIPGDSIKNKCIHFNKSLCSHLHPNRVASGELIECPDDCSHVIDYDEITIDGILLGRNYKYLDTVL